MYYTEIYTYSISTSLHGKYSSTQVQYTLQLFFHSKICPEEVYTIQYSLCRVQRSGAEDGAEDGAGRSRPFFNSGSG